MDKFLHVLTLLNYIIREKIDLLCSLIFFHKNVNICSQIGKRLTKIFAF